MKYFENINKINYSTSLGEFKVSDITTNFTLNLNETFVATTEVSKNTTLVELSSGLYKNPDFIWLFLYANNSVNPFTLTNEDTSTLVNEYESNKLFSAYSADNGKDVIIPAGSLVLPRTNNNGDTWQFGSTGQFSLTGGFALVQSFNQFSKIATLITPYGGITFGVNSPVNFIINGDTYYYYISSGGGTTHSANYVQSQNEGIKEIKYKDPTFLQFYGMLLDDGPVQQKGSGSAYVLAGVSTAISYEQAAYNRENKINYFLTSNSNYLNLNKIEQDYII